MMRDPYEVLGVPRTADAAAIKSAYRKLAKKHHPDANKNDAKAAQRFSEINSAYEILGEDDKRKAFDRGEIDAEGKPRGFEGFGAHPGAGGFQGGAGGFESFTWGPEGLRRSGGGRGPGGGGGGASGPGRGNFGGFEDVLKDMFGGFGGGAAQARRGGYDEFDPGEFTPGGRDVAANLTVSLAEAAAGGKKRVHLPTGKEVEVKIPVGIADGQQIRLKGQGMAGPGGAGDALITIAIAPDPRFVREGDNLRLDLPITLYEAVLGAKVRVPTLDGAVSLAIPPGTSGGRVFRLRGKGMPSKGGAPGDLLATVRIVLPAQSDPQLEELMRTWQDQKPYDPRKDLG